MDYLTEFEEELENPELSKEERRWAVLSGVCFWYIGYKVLSYLIPYLDKMYNT